MKYILICWFALLSLSVLGQTFSFFNKTWGDEFNYRTFSGVVTVDDGYLTIGHYLDTIEYSPFDLSKFDLNGNLIWRKNLSPTSDKETTILQKQMLKDANGDIVIAGLVGFFSEPSTRDTRIIKITKDGDIIWENEYGSKINETFNHIINTKDDGYLIVGSRQSVTPVQFARTYMLKIDGDGNKEWEQAFGYEEEKANGIAVSAISLEDGGFLIGGGLTDFEGSNSHLVIKIDSLGNYLWEKRFEAKCYISIYEMYDGNYLLSTCKYIDNDRHTYLIKTDTSLNIIWEQTYAPVNFPTNLFTNPIMKEDGGFIASVNFWNENENTQSLIIDFDSLGNINWTKDFTTDPLQKCAFTYVEKTLDGGYIWAGVQFSLPELGWLVKTDCQGNTCSFIGCDSIYVNRDTLADLLCSPVSYQEVCLSGIDDFLYSQDTIEFFDSLFYNLPFISNSSSDDFVDYYYLCENDRCEFFKDTVISIPDTGTYFIRGINILKEDTLILNKVIENHISVDSLQYFLDYNFACASVTNETFELRVILPEKQCSAQITDFMTLLDSTLVTQSYLLPELISNNDSVYTNYYYAWNADEVQVFKDQQIIFQEPDTFFFLGINILNEDTLFINNISQEKPRPDSLLNYFIVNEICASVTTNNLTLIIKEENTGVEALEVIDFFKIYPNPVSTQINLQTNLTRASYLHIYNQNGKLIHTSIIAPGDKQKILAVKDWSNGLYFFQLLLDDVVLKSGKFAVQR